MLEPVYGWVSFFTPYVPGYIQATGLVLFLGICSLILSWVIGGAFALGQLSRHKWLVKCSRFYVWFIRGTPTLTQVFLVFFGLPQLGIKFSPYMAGIIALGLNTGAYVAEIMRSGLQSVPVPQLLAGYALGLSPWRIFWRLRFPQALRVALPGLVSEAVTVIKNTSLLSVITVLEITLHSQIASAATFRPFDFYIASSLIYLLMTSVTMRVGSYMEKRLQSVT